ncbi:MAG: LptF/LptG family permease, partial [Rickettsiales bacterium]|nr:LptF/LptG family permease [Rickettsiales bacterium]
MKIIDRYLSRQLAGSFAGFGLVLAGLAWMVQLLLLLKLIVRNGLDIGGFLGMSLYTFPMLVGIIAPFVMFISVAFVYNRAISSSEITACYGAGLRPMALARPAIRTGFIVMVLHLASNLWLAPKTQDLFYGRQWELRYGLG